MKSFPFEGNFSAFGGMGEETNRRAKKRTPFGASKFSERMWNMVNETAKEGFRRLAFGGIHDAVRLLFCEDVNPRTLKNMDLFAVSEIRRPKNGGMEIRFFDRIEALRLLSELETSGTGVQALLSAIESGAAALKDGDKP